MDRSYYKAKLLNYLGHMVEHLKDSKAIIAGGCIRSLICGEEIKDIDTYFRSDVNLHNFMESAEVKSCSHIKSVTKRSITFTPNKDQKKTYQLIFFSYYQTAQEIFKDYDFSVCMGAYDFAIDDFVFGENFFEDNATKNISINTGTKYPLISIFRLFKYKNKGYDFPQKQLLELAKAINKFDYNDDNVVKDQTQGFYGIVENQKWEPFETTDLNWCYLSKIEYFVDKKGCKYSVLNTEFIDDKTFEKFKDKMVESSFKPIRFYKFVKKLNDHIFSSFYRDSFIYKIGEYVEDRGHGIYVNKLKDQASTYSGSSEGIQIEIEVESWDDIKDGARIYKGKVIGVVDTSKKLEEYVPF